MDETWFQRVRRTMGRSWTRPQSNEIRSITTSEKLVRLQLRFTLLVNGIFFGEIGSLVPDPSICAYLFLLFTNLNK